MKTIEQILIEKYDMETHTDGYEILGNNGLIACLISKPNSISSKDKWRVRFTTVQSFTRWSISCAVEEFFDTSNDVSNYLTAKELDIYKQLLYYLSEEFKRECLE